MPRTARRREGGRLHQAGYPADLPQRQRDWRQGEGEKR